MDKEVQNFQFIFIGQQYLVFSLNLIIYYSPFRFANITLCIDFCKKVNEKAANDCSLAAV